MYDIALKAEFQNGIKEIFVGASKDDHHALDFYLATGGKAENVIRFTYSTDNEITG